MENLEKMNLLINSIPDSTKTPLDHAQSQCGAPPPRPTPPPDDLQSSIKGKYIEDRYERNSRFQFLWNKLGSVLSDINQQCGREVLVAITPPAGSSQDGSDRKTLKLELPAINIHTKIPELSMTRKVVEIELFFPSERKVLSEGPKKMENNGSLVFVKEEKPDTEYGIRNGFNNSGFSNSILANSTLANQQGQDEERLYPCDHCPKTYKQKGHLGAHIRTAHLGVRFPCPHCDYKSTTNGNLKKHIEAKHIEGFHNFTVTEDMIEMDNEMYDHRIDYKMNDHQFNDDYSNQVDNYDTKVDAVQITPNINEVSEPCNAVSEPCDGVSEPCEEVSEPPSKRQRIAKEDDAETVPEDLEDSQKADISDFLKVCVDEGVVGTENEDDGVENNDDFGVDNDDSLDEDNLMIKQEYEDGECTEDGSIIKQENLEFDESDITDPERFYSCDQCDKTFKQKGHLGVHLKAVHQGIRFPCSICDYKATTKGNLKQHVGRRHKFVDNDMIDYENIEGVVENETNGVLAIMDNDSFGFKEEQPEGFDPTTPPAKCYPCELCEKTFKQKGHLGVHIKSFHQGKRFPCTVCNYKATTNGNLKRHIEQRHVPQTDNMWAPESLDWGVPSEQPINEQMSLDYISML